MQTRNSNELVLLISKSAAISQLANKFGCTIEIAQPREDLNKLHFLTLTPPSPSEKAMTLDVVADLTIELGKLLGIRPRDASDKIIIKARESYIESYFKEYYGATLPITAETQAEVIETFIKQHLSPPEETSQKSSPASSSLETSAQEFSEPAHTSPLKRKNEMASAQPALFSTRPEPIKHLKIQTPAARSSSIQVDEDKKISHLQEEIATLSPRAFNVLMERLKASYGDAAFPLESEKPLPRIFS